MTIRILTGDCRERLATLPAASVRGRFVKGQHWRQPQPHWQRDWLVREYVERGRSTGELAAEIGCTDANMLYWLRKQGIPRRSVSGARAIKHWGQTGSANPMHGRIGAANPRYVDGSSPERQRLYVQGSGREFLRGDTAPVEQARQAAAGSLGAGSARSGGRVGRREAAAGQLLSRCVTAREGSRQDYETETLIAHSLRADGFDASEDGTGRGTPLVPVVFNNTGHGWWNEAATAASIRKGDDAGNGGARESTLVAFTCKDYGADSGDLAPTLRAMPHDGSHANAGGQVAVAFNWQSGGDCRGLDPQPTTMALQREQTPAVLTSAVRRLTPLECERLMGLPDGWTRIPVKILKNKPRTKHFAKYPDLYDRQDDGSWLKHAADGPRYRALGNSMAVPVVRWILQRLEQEHDR